MVLMKTFFFRGIIWGTPDKRISEVLFGRFFFLFRGFIDIIGGTPDKRMSDGLF